MQKFLKVIYYRNKPLLVIEYFNIFLKIHSNYFSKTIVFWLIYLLHFSNILKLSKLHNSYFRFLYIDVGCQGRISDGGVFHQTRLHEAIENGSANIPPDAPYPNTHVPRPFVMVGDEAFPLRTYLMKPFPQRNLSNDQRKYNYRLSRARRIVENAFGILANRYDTQ